MPLINKNILNQAAEVIRTETKKWANTAQRVGKMFQDFINSVSESIDEIDKEVGQTVNDIEDIKNILPQKANNTDLALVDQKADAAGQIATNALNGLSGKADNSTVSELDEKVTNLQGDKAEQTYVDEIGDKVAVLKDTTVPALANRVTDVENNKVDRSQIGVAGGVAPISGDGKIATQYIAYMLNGVDTLSNTSTHSEIAAVIGGNPELLADAVIRHKTITNISTNDPLYNNAMAICSNVDNPENVRYINLYFVVGFDPEYLSVQFDISNLNALKVEIQQK